MSDDLTERLDDLVLALNELGHHVDQVRFKVMTARAKAMADGYGKLPCGCKSIDGWTCMAQPGGDGWVFDVKLLRHVRQS